MKVCIIDDTRSTTSFFKHDVEVAVKNAKVTEKWELPEDESELDDFDVLVVDNSGIGNSTFRSGFDFLKTYARAHPDKLLVFHTGILIHDQMKKLEPLGVKCIEKTWNQAPVIELLKKKAH